MRAISALRTFKKIGYVSPRGKMGKEVEEFALLMLRGWEEEEK